MKSRIMTHRVFLLIFLLSTLWLTALTLSTASATAPDVSSDETLTFERSENKMGRVLQATSATAAEHEIQPANSNASNDAKKVLSYIAGLPDRQENRVISGQYVGTAVNAQAADGYQDFVVDLHTATGKWVGMIGIDYGFDPTAEEISDANEILIDYWDNGGLATITCHFDNPWTGGDSWDLDQRDLEELIDPESEVYETWMAELDKVATGLAELRDAGVVVLWRPFHEMTFISTFWWDAGACEGYWNEGKWISDPEPFIDIWKHMYDYFTSTKGLDNLLWVYAAADTHGWHSVDSLYPGDDYVDIVGIDLYDDNVAFSGGMDAYNTIVALGKPFANVEFGPATMDGNYDNTKTIDEIRDRYPQASYFMYWCSWQNHKAALVDNRNASALLNDPWVITRDEVDWRSELSTSIPTCTPTPTPALTSTPTPSPTNTPNPTETSIALPANSPTFAPTPSSTPCPTAAILVLASILIFAGILPTLIRQFSRRWNPFSMNTMPKISVEKQMEPSPTPSEGGCTIDCEKHRR